MGSFESSMAIGAQGVSEESSFEVAHEVLVGDGFVGADEEVDVICDSIDGEGIAAELLNDAYAR